MLNRSDSLGFTIGGGGLAAPIWARWLDWLSQGWYILIAIGGGVIILLTIYSKCLEIKQRRRDLEPTKR